MNRIRMNKHTSKYKIILLSLIPILIFLGVWEFFAQDSNKISFLFGSPSKIFIKIYEHTINGELLNHMLTTGFEALIGLILGVIVGSSLGFLLLSFPTLRIISKYYVLALSSIPVFALAPMMIIWFGIGILMKIAFAFFATVFVALFQAYKGGMQTNKNEEKFFKLHKASRKKVFKYLILPASVEWLIQSLRINAGLAVLGAFIGEFIASDVGLGYLIIKAGGLYDVSLVLAGVIYIILLTLFLNFLATLVEKYKLNIIRFFSN